MSSHRPATPCSEPTCPNLRPCARHSRPTSSTAQGYGAPWRRLRDATPRTPCVDCGTPWHSRFNLDHDTSRRQGGPDGEGNLVWRCPSCHSRKTARTDGGFGNAVRLHG